MDEDEDIPTKRSLVIFGRDVSKIPCFRNSYLYGVGSGIAGGLTCFMFTSRPRVSCHFGVLTFTVVTLSYWTRCRYNYSSTKFEMQRMQELVRRSALYEGTDTEKALLKNLEKETVDA